MTYPLLLLQFPVIITRANNVYGPHQYPEKVIYLEDIHLINEFLLKSADLINNYWSSQQACPTKFESTRIVWHISMKTFPTFFVDFQIHNAHAQKKKKKKNYTHFIEMVAC